jgi:uncharacterized iron-regulated membrane protein
MSSLPTPVVVVIVWLFGSVVVLPAVLLAWVKYERWVRERRARRHAGQVIEWAPAAARGERRRRRPVPPAVDRKRNGRPLEEGAGRETSSRAEEEAWRE